jgi:hypothetical protein
MMTAEEKYTTLKRIFWDYNTEELSLDKAVRGDFGEMDEYEFNLIFNRMLERLSWYELLDIVGADSMKRFLTKERISRIRLAEFREKYEFIRRILSGEPLSFTGWGDEFIKKHRQSLLSNRWYRAQ